MSHQEGGEQGSTGSRIARQPENQQVATTGLTCCIHSDQPRPPSQHHCKWPPAPGCCPEHLPPGVLRTGPRPGLHIQECT